MALTNKLFLFKNSTINYSDSGVGRVVVLLHGFLENQKMWSAISPELAKNNRVITLDLLGHGESQCTGYVHTMTENALEVKALLDHLKIKKAALIGHSMGGYVALAFIEKNQKSSAGLLLLNSTALADNFAKRTNRDRAIRAVKTDHTTFVRLAINNLFAPESRKRLTNEIEITKIEALKTPLQGIIASLEGMKTRDDLSHLLSNNNFPIEMVLGKKDPVLEIENTVLQLKNTSVKLTILPDGHMSHLENQELLLPILIAFCKKCG